MTDARRFPFFLDEECNTCGSTFGEHSDSDPYRLEEVGCSGFVSISPAIIDEHGDGRSVYGPLQPPLADYKPCALVYYWAGDIYCPACATHERDYCADYHKSEPEAWTHEEGAPYSCESCGKRLYSEYGDPDCLVCGGEVSGTRDGVCFDCPECCSEKATLQPWMEENIKNAGF